jgi:hypothetical protein
MRRNLDPARRERERLLTLERRAQAQAEGQAVAAGVAETVALSEARGAAFEAATKAPGRRETPYRRQSGLEWLLRKGRLSAAQAAAGARYGDCYRRAMAQGSIPSTLDVKPRSSAPEGGMLAVVMARAERSAHAGARLAAYRERLCGQADLIAACDRICGEELTPREAAGGEREAGKLEAVLGVALDLLAHHAR